MRTCFFDLETTALRASFGQLLCGVIGEFNPMSPEQPVLSTYTLADFSTPIGRCNDQLLAEDIAGTLEEFDLVIGYNSIMFDKKFLDTRLAKYGLPGCVIKRHKDLLYVMRSKFSLQSNSLENVARFLFGDTVKTKLSLDLWRLAHAGSIEAYAQVVEHCQYDVIELARVWNRVKSVAGDLR